MKNYEKSWLDVKAKFIEDGPAPKRKDITNKPDPSWTTVEIQGDCERQNAALAWLNETAGPRCETWEMSLYQTWITGTSTVIDTYHIKDPNVAFWFKMTFA